MNFFQKAAEAVTVSFLGLDPGAVRSDIKTVQRAWDRPVPKLDSKEGKALIKRGRKGKIAPFTGLFYAMELLRFVISTKLPPLLTIDQLRALDAEDKAARMVGMPANRIDDLDERVDYPELANVIEVLQDPSADEEDLVEAHAEYVEERQKFLDARKGQVIVAVAEVAKEREEQADVKKAKLGTAVAVGAQRALDKLITGLNIGDSEAINAAVKLGLLDLSTAVGAPARATTPTPPPTGKAGK